MSLKNDKFASSSVLDDINTALSSDDSTRREAINQTKTSFTITLTNAQGDQQSWFIDLKDKGVVGIGTGNKSEVTLILSDDDFGKLVAGKANAQKLFMSGKLKIKGNVMKATKLDPVLKKLQSKPKL